MNVRAVGRSEARRSLDLFGSTVRVYAGVPRAASLAPPELAILAVEAGLRAQHRRLTRFEEHSELSLLNRSPDETVTISPTLVSFLAAARWAALRTEGLVDATVLGAVLAAGYRRSFVIADAVDLHDALTHAPPRRPALAQRPSPWLDVALDEDAGLVTRPQGLAFDSGGIAKGHAADLGAERLAGYSSFAVDCGGDIRIGGQDGLERRIEIADPFTGDIAATFGLTEGAVATSGIGRRLWRSADGVSHHLMDPGRGEPAWTGLVQATAVAPTALEAEALAKVAMLAGPEAASRWLGRFGGAVFSDDGGLHAYGRMSEHLTDREGAIA